MMQSRPLRLWFVAFPCLLVSTFLVMGAGVFSQSAVAQDQNAFATEGYITAVNPPKGFDVNGEHVATFSGTAYELMGSDATGSDDSLRSALRVGVYVQVVGVKDRLNKFITPVIAKEVLLPHDGDRPLTGFGVIDKVISDGPEPVFQADGYRIRITSATKTVFPEGLKTLADVGANTWLHYKGKRDAAGDLVASQVDFIPAKPSHFKAVPGVETHKIQLESPHASLQGGTSVGSEAPSKDASDQEAVLTQDGKVKLAPLGGWHKVPANQALQDRVRNVGMRLVPDYQKQLPADHPSKIDFRFYAIDDAGRRAEVCSVDGLILIPAQVVERLKNDDQLAAVLADGVAYNLERQAARTVATSRKVSGSGLAVDIAGAFVPGVGIAAIVGANAAAEEQIAMEEQRGRVALALLSDAGFDSRQAPEAWRLLEPKHLPKKLDALKYPNRSGYQLGVLKLQYSRTVAAEQ